MIPQKSTKKPALSNKSNKKIQSYEEKLQKIEYFYRYRLPSIYRQLKNPIYQNLVKIQKPVKPNIVSKPSQNSKNNLQQYVQILYKKLMLNSKYHHRQKIRFTRAPMFKYLKYDFKTLQAKIKEKKYMKMYDDLEDDDQDDDEKQKKQYQVNSQFSVQSIERYKKKNNIKGKIVIAYGYEDLKARLVNQHDWTENKDYGSLIYNFKYMSKKKDIDYVNLLDDQVVNHFNQNKEITAKFGLTRNIRNLASASKDCSKFFPRCFDVNDVAQLQNFYQSFKQSYVQSILKLFLQNKGCYPQNSNVQQMNNKMIQCIKIAQNLLLPLQKKIKLAGQNKQLFISIQEWNQIKNLLKIFKNKYEPNQKFFNKVLYEKIQNICKQWQDQDPEWYLNKQNIWIIKPASMSRGRGIKTFDDIDEIFAYIIGKQISWVAQKYIENPLIIKKRKFDIRQWVLVTDFKPFRVWVYQQCYVRFCASLYTTQNLKDRKIHLTNNSVTKGQTQLNDGIQQNMMSQKDFASLLKELQGHDIFEQKIRPQINKVSVQALQSVKQNIIARKNTFQIFGFDYMIDQNYKIWLIEVNSSPTMEHSTKVTTNIVKKGMSDLADLINNYMFKGKVYHKQRARQLYGGWNLLTNNT